MNLDLIKPIMAEVTATVTARDGPLREREQRIYDKECREVEMMYEAEIKSFVDRKQTYMNNLGKAYAFILGQCNKALQNKLYARTDYESEIKGNPIKLLMAIEEHSMSYVENRYETSTVLDSMKNFVNLKQHNDESLVDYTMRFKSARDIFKSHIGGKMKIKKLAASIEGWDDNDESTHATCYNKAYDAFVSLLYLENANKNKYGSLLTGLSTQFSLGQDQYPKDLIGANNVLSNHKFDTAYYEYKKKQKDKSQVQQNRPANPNRQNDDQVSELSFAQMEKRCFCCGKVGHTSDKCNKRNSTPKAEWAMNKTPEMRRMMQQHAQQTQTQPSETSSVTTSTTDTPSVSFAQPATQSNEPFGWMHSQVILHQASSDNQLEIMQGQILLDSQSSVDLFCNPKMVEKVQRANSTLKLATNAGTMETKDKAIVPKYGEVWFDKNAITNVFSLANMTKKHQVTFDSDDENAFIVHTEGGKMKFKLTHNNLYAYKSHQQESDEGMGKNKPTSLIQTVTENEKFYTKRQLQRAQVARNLLHALGNPTIQDLKTILRLNTIKNCPVTNDDLDIMKRVYGPDPATIKGKTTRQKPAIVVHDTVAILRELIKT